MKLLCWLGRHDWYLDSTGYEDERGYIHWRTEHRCNYCDKVMR